MTAAVAQPARFVALPDAAPVLMRDVEDLHDADLDRMLAEELSDASGAVAAAQALARLVTRPGPAAVTAHDLGEGAARLALR
jgi:hypothetical protein